MEADRLMKTRLERIAHALDAPGRVAGRVALWTALVLVIVAATNTIVRYVGTLLGQNLSSNRWIELQWYLFAIMILLSAAHGIQKDVHVRVDAIYERLRPARRAWINLAGWTFLFMPFMAWALLSSYDMAAESWLRREASSDPDGLLRYPLKMLIPAAFALLVLQGVSAILHCIIFLRQPRQPAGDDHV